MSNCVDCLQKCNGTIISDKCVQTTLGDIPLLGICDGDSLFEVEEIILNLLPGLMNGTGIVVSGLTACHLVNNILLAQTPTVPVLFQTTFTALCSLQTQIDAINVIVTAGYTFNTSCLTGVTGTSSRDQILQATITKACSNATRITAIENDYVKASTLCTVVQQCITGGPTNTDFNLRMVPNCPIPYIGSLSNFDNTGKGLVSTGFSKIYLMNGLNGTPDWRGRSPIGAIQNVPGGVLDPEVDPTLPQNVGTNYVLNGKIGKSSVALTLPQMPSHTHGVNDPGHKHRITGYVGGGASNFAAGQGNFWYNNPDTETAVTNISLNSSGGGLAHTNIQPSIATYYIIYIP